MRILFLNNPPLIKYGLSTGFRLLNWETEVFPLWKYPKNEHYKILKDIIISWKPNIIFVEGFPLIDWKAIASLKADYHHIFSFFYWAIEDPVNTLHSKKIAIIADHVFTTTEECLQTYAKWGIPSSLLLFGCNPDFHRKRVPRPEYTHDICLLAANYDRRFEKVYNILLNPIIRHGYDILVAGPYWLDKKRKYNLTKYPDIVWNNSGYFAYEEMPSLYSSCKIVLNVNQVWDSKTQTSMRVYETLACGAFSLGYYTKALENLFVKGKHLEWSTSPVETIELITYYLKNNDKRINIANWGQQFVYENHTYKQRAQTVINIYNKLRGIK